MKWNNSWTKMRGNSARLQSNAMRRSRTNAPACTTPRRPPRACALWMRMGAPEIGGRRRNATPTWSRREASSNKNRWGTGTLQDYKTANIGIVGWEDTYVLPSTYTFAGGWDDDPGGRASELGAIGRLCQLARAKFARRNRQTRGRALRGGPAPGSQAHYLPGSLHVVRGPDFRPTRGR